MHSMTGFGRGTAHAATWRAVVEIHSVNRKQAEVVVQLPRELSGFDARVRQAVLGIVSRGRIQVSVQLERGGDATVPIRVNAALARGFDAAFAELSQAVGRVITPTAADYLRQSGIIDTGAGELDPEEAWQAVLPALDGALAALAAMREAEGAHLKQDLQARLGVLVSCVGEITAAAPARPARQRELLMRRLREAGLELDSADERVLREIALFADRCDISEELTRLGSHFMKFRDYLDASDPPGRALDFLCQEIFREFNTIGSKANDAGIAQTIVAAKTELEKMREQVQNVE